MNETTILKSIEVQPIYDDADLLTGLAFSVGVQKKAVLSDGTPAVADPHRVAFTLSDDDAADFIKLCKKAFKKALGEDMPDVFRRTR
jgi:hypothetical protein